MPQSTLHYAGLVVITQFGGSDPSASTSQNFLAGLNTLHSTASLVRPSSSPRPSQKAHLASPSQRTAVRLLPICNPCLGQLISHYSVSCTPSRSESRHRTPKTPPPHEGTPPRDPSFPRPPSDSSCYRPCLHGQLRPEEKDELASSPFPLDFIHPALVFSGFPEQKDCCPGAHLCPPCRSSSGPTPSQTSPTKQRWRVIRFALLRRLVSETSSF
jgi:hypothetical protein